MDENTTLNSPLRVPLGGDYWKAEPTAPLWGFADLHAHLMAHLAFGGKAFWGQPYDPEHPGEEGMQTALSSCAPIHGGLIDVNPEFGHPAGGGWPEFIIWPRFTTIVHQQAYIDWLYRAYQGGLRLVTCLAVNNELLAIKTTPLLPHDDKSAIQVQIHAMKEMAAYVDQQSGGPGQGWLQVAYSPQEAYQIIAANKLAVILGVEVDSLGNWHNLAELRRASGGSLKKARRLICQELDWLHDMGVRQITPIHLTNNAFGGTAIYMRFLETVNFFLTGETWQVRDAWKTGVRYRMDQDGDDMVNEVERTIAMSGGRKKAMHRRTLVDQIPGIRTLVEAFDAPTLRGGHANVRGLNRYGRILLDELMAHGMIIDIDHMSEKATDSTLDLAEKQQYPLICSHTWFRDLLFSAQDEFDAVKKETYGTSDVHKVAHEAGKRGDQIERIGRLGGVVAPILNQGDIAGLKRCIPELAGKIPNPSAGSSTSFAQAYLYAAAKTGGRGVAIGSDINGAAALPGPRFGTSAAFGASHDARRTPTRRSEIEAQKNGVAYRQPIIDHRWHRFEGSGPGAYTEEECNIWQAIAQYHAGFNPDNDKHPASDFPELTLKGILDAVHEWIEYRWIDNVTEGLWMGDSEEPIEEHVLAGWPDEKRAAYFSRRDIVEKNSELLDARTRSLFVKIEAIWARWLEMDGDNDRLERSTAGTNRDFDINLDGMAHYGMLPDLLQDIRNSGLTPEDFTPLFRGAYDYVQMWSKCEERAAEIVRTRDQLTSRGAE